MTVNDLTEKEARIFVNGTHHTSYDQRANSSDYDVSVSDNKTIVNGVLQSEFGWDKTSDTPEYLTLNFDVLHDGISGIDTIEVILRTMPGTVTEELSVNGSLVADGSISGTHSVSLSDGDTIEAYVETDDPSNNDESVISLTINLHGDYNTSTGFSVDGVTQS